MLDSHPVTQAAASEPRSGEASRLAPRTTGREAMRERVAGAIVEAAAGVFSRSGTDSSMADVAAAAGVARATVYRYFPTREALLQRLATVAVRDAGGRLAEAQLDTVRAEEGVSRAARALLEVGDYFTVLARERVRFDAEEYERSLLAPLRRLIERGQSEREFRDDVPAEWLTTALVEFVVSVVPSTPAFGRDDTVAALTTFFMDGARARIRPVAR